MNKVFISYRREDSQVHAGRLSDLLATQLANSIIFMDVDGISPGEDFVQKIGEQLSACSVFLPVIGPRWPHVRRGLRRRLFLPNDFVRLEVLAAIHRPIQVIPVLVGGATMPRASSLPKSIRALVDRNATALSDDRFRADVSSLADAIKKRVGDFPEMEGDALQSERARVTQIIETDILQARRRDRVQFSILLTAAFLVLMIAVSAWVLSRWSVAEPRFAQAKMTPDLAELRVDHPDDTATWKMLNDEGYMSRPQPFSRPRGGTEPVLKLSDVLGSRGPKAVAAIEKSGQIMFDAVGSTGNVKYPRYIYMVADRMAEDFNTSSPAGLKPSFLFLLGDVILNFGEGKYYYDQFYSPFRNYPAPILAIAGNHDGSIELGSAARPLDAFLANFCAEKPFHKSTDALDLDRTAQIQPGVYFTFEAPFVRILALYSNISEQQGTIASPELSDVQLDFIEAAFRRIKSEHFQGAVIIAVHHDMLGAGAHSGSPTMLSQIDMISGKTGVWPHLVLSAHAHNYQRFTRTVGATSIQYVVAGTGGANLLRFNQPNPQSTDIALQHFDATRHGYLRITADRKQLHVDFQTAEGEASRASDTFTLDLQSRRLVP
jgi:TIR domain/Calcineurin-like phosphoesterase